MTAADFVPVFDAVAKSWEERDREIAEEREERERKLAAEARVRWNENMIRAGVPGRRLEEALAADVDLEAPAIKALDSWSEDRNILVIAGPIGVGKTIAAVLWLQANGGRRPLFMRASAFEARGRYDHDTRQAWERSTGFVLDDLGVEYTDARGNFAALLDELVDLYTGGHAGLVITTNLDASKFRERYGERVASRIVKFGNWRNIRGEDRRRRR